MENEIVEDTASAKQEEIIIQKNHNHNNKNHKKVKVIGIVLLVLVIFGGITCGILWKLGYFDKKEEIVSTDNKEYLKYQMKGNDLQDFDIRFLQLENEEKNKIYSPLSIKYALAMLKEGANGNTKKQITDVIGKYSTKKYENSDNMSLANAMFIKDAYKESIKKEYVSKLKTKYNAEVLYDSFETPNAINDWVKGKTFNLIEDLVDDASQNDYFLVNALAIDMEWNNQIHCATGSNVPCLVTNYHIQYDHEKIKGEEKSYSDTSYVYNTEEQFYYDHNKGYNEKTYKEKRTFNGSEGVKGGDVLADFNRYDIIKEIGEDKIREIVRPEYEKWLQSEDGQLMLEHNSNSVEKDVEKYLDKYIEEIKSNYNKSIANTDFYIYEDDNVKSFAKDLKTYNGTTLQYVGIMPKEEKLTNYVKNLKASDVNKTIKGLQEVKIDNFKEGYATRIRGSIPFFNFDYELALLEDLKTIGITDVFDAKKADLSNMTSSNSYIDKAIHKANIEFTNDGIKAAAATAAGGAGGTSGGFDYLFEIPVINIDITFDKPYMFIIRDKSSGEVWFAGTVYEPTK